MNHLTGLLRFRASGTESCQAATSTDLQIWLRPLVETQAQKLGLDAVRAIICHAERAHRAGRGTDGVVSACQDQFCKHGTRTTKCNTMILYEHSALNCICSIHEECSMGKHNGRVVVTQSVSRVSTRAQLWRRAFLLQGKARVFPSTSHGFSPPLRETGMDLAINNLCCS